MPASWSLSDLFMPGPASLLQTLSRSWKVTMSLILQGLDRVIAQAAAHNIRVILTLTNYWPDYGGPPIWAKWFNRSTIVEFYQDPSIR